MKYYLAFKQISKKSFYDLVRTKKFVSYPLFNSSGDVNGVRLYFKEPLHVDFSTVQHVSNPTPVQLSLFDEYENK